MKLTADTITDEQIRELLDYARHNDATLIGDCRAALSNAIPMRFDSKRQARARCAEILNARNGAKP